MSATETHGHDDHGAHDEGAVHVHIAPARFYWGIFGALTSLTIVTVYASTFNFGSANTIIAIIIATMKASLVAAFFMHLRHDKLFNTFAFLSAFLFLGIFLLLTSDDLFKRGRTDDAYGTRVFPPTGEVAPGGFPSAMAVPSASASGHGEGHGEPPQHH
jgi:cytochrome c oxidase subunit 4